MYSNAFGEFSSLKRKNSVLHIFCLKREQIILNHHFFQNILSAKISFKNASDFVQGINLIKN